MNEGVVAAIDIGASSGRVILGWLGPRGLALEEVHRFPNDPVQLGDGLHWDALRLHHEIVTGLRLRKVQEPILALKEVTPEILAQCEELGAALAAGLAMGVY